MREGRSTGIEALEHELLKEKISCMTMKIAELLRKQLLA